MAKKKKVRTITSSYVPTEKERKQAEMEGSEFLTEEEKDEIEVQEAEKPKRRKK